ncbi:MAG: RNA-binding S4 domain-containing protein [Clostridia bacterium]|nr:RNA-binding S4 domain-containing protein [Clostridia bacterium]
MSEGVRIDKWLWAVRVFKTRSMASEACRTGKVTIAGQPVKPSRDTKLGDEVAIKISPQLTRTLRVKELLQNRVAARLVPEFADDLTPPEAYEHLKMISQLNYERRDRGAGRPTKKERRDIDRLKEEE